MKTITEQPLPLLEVLKKLAPDSSHNTLRSWIAQGRVCVDEQSASKATFIVPAGSEVSVRPRLQFASEGIKILFEDDHLVVVEKPAGILSVASAAQTERTVHAIIKKRRRTQGITYPVHRLDRETSGVMVFAYTTTARDHLKKQFMERAVLKEYEAIVEGTIPQPKGKWESYLAEDPFYFVASTPDVHRGKLAITSYEILDHNRRFTHLKLYPLTGRKNQLRVHCQEAGHPIAGDKKYGAKTNPIHRLCLHARKIAFTHPVTLKPLEFESPVPSTFLEGIFR